MILQFQDLCATYSVLCCAAVKQHIIATAITFSGHNNSFSVNDAPLCKILNLNFLLYDVTLFNVIFCDFQPLWLKFICAKYFKNLKLNAPKFCIFFQLLYRSCVIDMDY